MKQIIFATGNAGKMKEIREILDGTGWNVLSLKDAGIDADIEENGTTFEENAKIKAEGIRNWCLENGIPGCSGIPAKEIIVLADDSGWKSTGWAESRAFILRAIWGMKPLTVKKTPTSSAVWTASRKKSAQHVLSVLLQQPCRTETVL